MYNVNLKSEKDRLAFLKRIEAEIKSAQDKASHDQKEKDYIRKLKNVKDDINVHPLRFDSLLKKLKKNPDHEYSKMDKETILLALEKAYQFSPLLDETLKQHWKHLRALLVHTGELNKDDPNITNSRKHQKANYAAFKEYGFVSDKKGKKNSWTLKQDKEITTDYNEYLKGCLPKLDAVALIKDKYKFQSLRSAAEYLRKKLGFKAVPEGRRNR